MITVGNQIELRHLRYFQAVAEELHFRRAAEQLFISQPALSRQIKQLEEILGVQLLDRTNRKVQLTHAGAYFAKETDRLLKQLSNTVNQTQHVQDGGQGTIRIAYVGSAMQDIIPELLIQFRKSYPAIKFVLKEMDNNSQVEALMEHDFDLGFLRLKQVPVALSIKPVLKDTFSLVLAEDHPVSVDCFTGLEQFSRDDFILFEKNYSPIYYERVMSIFEQAGFQPNIAHYSVHATTIFQLVANHFGISIIPTALTHGYSMKVKFIELKAISQRAVLSVASHKENRNPIVNKILAFLDKVDLSA